MHWLEKILRKKRAYSYSFPYSDDSDLKKQELIENLENGVLFEDLELFVEWNVPFRNLEHYVWRKEKNRLFSDTGQHTILDGLQVFVDPHKTMLNSLPFIDLSSFLGFDDQGHQKYVAVKKHLADRFGEPTELENTLPYDFYGDKSARWIFRKFQISLNVWERFAVHYNLRIECLPDRTTAKNRFSVSRWRAGSALNKDGV